MDDFAEQQPKLVAAAGKRRRRLIARLKHTVFALGTLLLSAVLTYYFGEAIYRFSKYREPVNAGVVPDVVTEFPLDEFDDAAGYRYLPNVRTRYLDWGPTPRAGARPLIENVVRTNNQGHISWQDDVLDKPPSVFRVAVLGDSFTAALEMSKPWSDLLEEYLNRDAALKETLGVSRFDVINFGRDGIGIVQCAAIHEHEVSRYSANLVILNFIADDIPRRFEYRRTVHRDLGDFRYQVTVHTYALPCSLHNPESFLGSVSLDRADFESAERWRRVRQDLARLQLQRIAWFSPYPEFLGSRLGYPRLFSSDVVRYDRENGLARALQACRDIKGTSKAALFLHIPHTRGQLTAAPVLVSKMIAACPDLEITLMSRFLLETAELDDVDRWFIPGDGHFNDHGGDVYARAVHRKLREHFGVVDSDWNRATK